MKSKDRYLSSLLAAAGLLVAAGCATVAPTEPGATREQRPAADRWGWTPLHHAVRDSDMQTVRRLVDGPTTTARDKHQRTPLHIAAMWGRVEAAEALLDAGADIHAEDQWGVTPLRRAELMEQVRNLDRTEFKRMLRARGAER